MGFFNAYGEVLPYILYKLESYFYCNSIWNLSIGSVESELVIAKKLNTCSLASVCEFMFCEDVLVGKS